MSFLSCGDNSFSKNPVSSFESPISPEPELLLGHWVAWSWWLSLGAEARRPEVKSVLPLLGCVTSESYLILSAPFTSPYVQEN